jgi:hypothetical protein
MILAVQSGETIKAFWEQMWARESRPTVLNPIYQFTRLFVSSAIFSALAGAPPIVIVIFAGCSGAALLLAGWSYLYFMKRDPDRLCSENFLQYQLEMSIERERIINQRGVSETVSESQVITEADLSDESVIVLDYAPVPTSVRLFLDSSACLPKTGGTMNYHIDGHRVIIENPTVRQKIASLIHEGKGEIRVEYRHSAEDVTQWSHSGETQLSSLVRQHRART